MSFSSIVFYFSMAGSLCLKAAQTEGKTEKEELVSLLLEVKQEENFDSCFTG